jgi:hypothetical protein
MCVIYARSDAEHRTGKILYSVNNVYICARSDNMMLSDVIT